MRGSHGVIDRRTPTEIAGAEELDAMIAEVAGWDAAALATIRADLTRENLTAADEADAIGRYRAYVARRRNLAGVGVEYDRRLAKWVKRHGHEPKTAAEGADWVAYLLKPVLKAAAEAEKARALEAERERVEHEQASAEAIQPRQAARRGSRAVRARTAVVASPGPESEPAVPVRRRRPRPVGVIARFDPITGEIRRPITDND
ncbi:hypothetical protein ACFM35_05005 [Microbacterium sp. P01]|uniref:hypothetical protein n=1 Tax=Microbacterium sp. P01 TaxID=3366261 RepID=UPI00366AFFDE